jgi:hypothetical protein
VFASGVLKNNVHIVTTKTTLNPPNCGKKGKIQLDNLQEDTLLTSNCSNLRPENTDSRNRKNVPYKDNSDESSDQDDINTKNNSSTSLLTKSNLNFSSIDRTTYIPNTQDQLSSTNNDLEHTNIKKKKKKNKHRDRENIDSNTDSLKSVISCRIIWSF